MNKKCQKCSREFEIAGWDRKFYDELELNGPKLCPECRAQRRMSWRNEKNLYKRKCGLCEKGVVSIYSEDKLFPVYCQECFWGDKWNALDFGQNYDFDKPFFEQFYELQKRVPRLAIINKQSQNSDYCNYSFANKNCYLTFGNHYEEDCMYGRYSTKNRNCLDYLFTYNNELCYENTFSKNCYRSVYLEHSEGCQDCYFSTDLTGCKNCLFSANLKHKEFYIFNEPHSEEEYFEKLKELRLDTYEGFQKARDYFEREVRTKFPHRAGYQVNCQDCSGSNLTNCKNVTASFDCTNCEDVKYAVQCDETYDAMDQTCMGYDKSEVCYETIGCSAIFNCIVCDSCWNDSDLTYCNLCFSVKNSFGCISLQQKENCILNKQYSKSEYEELLNKIIDHMESGGEWGEFFPTEISPFAYNETIAQEFYPLKKEEILAKRWRWRDVEDYVADVKGTIATDDLPQAIGDVRDSILDSAISCAVSGRPFKLQKAELEFYRTLNLPVPRVHPQVRLEERMKRRPPRKLYSRTCDKCQAQIETIFADDRPEKVYCESCYLKEVY